MGRLAGALSSIRPDDMAALVIKEILNRTGVDPNEIEEIYLGCANQAGEDNRNVARMSSLLAGLPVDASAMTINRLCGSGMDAVGTAARAIKSGDTQLMIAGGVESMTRAPFVLPKPNAAFSRSNELYDTTMGWRFVNQLMQQEYGVESMPETAENVAEEFSISRADQDLFAYRSQMKTARAQDAGILAEEIIPVSIEQRK
ncbi:beta-ketoacyl synthase N-terminal-like domain-containing protein, partial [Amphritea sp.]|uniref:thiolase family protein n=1 Tax=Amphritea sp. TaxID=1872502 RepID=UPI003D0ABBDF